VAPVCNFHTARRYALPVLVALGLVTSLASPANAYVVKRTSHGDLVHWNERNVEFTLDPSVATNVTSGDEATIAALGSWSGEVGAPDLRVHAPNASSPTKPGFDSKNGVFYMANGWEPAGRALAITVLTYDNANGRILDADVIFNGAYRFAVLEENKPWDATHLPVVRISSEEPTDGDETHDEAVPRSTNTITNDEEVSVYDLHHVVAHELGHALGMNDEMNRKDALMYRYSAPNDPSLRQPASDDIAGLAELYATKLEGRGAGCGATVAPKKPTPTASYAAALATLGLLIFLALRAKRDRRARLGFVLAAAGASLALLPSLSGGNGVARANTSASELAVGHARAKVLGVTTSIEHGLFRTSYRLATVDCHAGASCPTSGEGKSWGGTVGNITQDVGGHYAPVANDDVDVSFKVLTNRLASLNKPLQGRVQDNTAVRVITKHR
jgi:hypothetical protein